MSEQHDQQLKLRSAGVVWREVDGETVVLHLDSSEYFSVNGPGTVLWAAMARGATRDELVEELTARYGIEPGRARADVEAFVDACHARGVLE